MHLIGILLVVAQLALIIHAVRTGADKTWLYALLFLPGVGGVAYFLTQVLPRLLASPRPPASAESSLLHAVDPQRELQRRHEKLASADTLANRLALADECIAAGFVDEAAELYRGALVLPGGAAPEIRAGLASVLFQRRDYAEVQRLLDEVIAAHPDYRSTDAHLLYARALVGQERFNEAVDEYEVLIDSYPGEEARVRFAILLRQLGQGDRSEALFNDIIDRSRDASAEYRQRESWWIDAAHQRGAGVTMDGE